MGAGSPPADKEQKVTETQDLPIISEALGVIDGALNDFLHRELVSSNEVTDLLLDVRSVLSKSSTKSVEDISGLELVLEDQVSAQA
ncbi:MAG TPA: hypothetical protein DCP89_01665 [Acidimicrobiaceae bacterium]|jgi:hypothetical protein|nr:hypothetical protein [Actinomycetota bacterium]HAN07183.1 hypothetical protein [Acidimicrobiaceae bacterium]|tara:strand:+ start:1530 stop:1787 length:258 start_codon:yes stop_codon:yes gene_type:complete